MEWFFWMFGIWFVMSLVGRHTCSSRYWTGHDRRQLRARRAGHWHPYRLQSARDTSPTLRAGRATRPAPTRPEETPEERIRRRFVEGRIDLDQYEAELWEELRPK